MYSTHLSMHQVCRIASERLAVLFTSLSGEPLFIMLIYLTPVHRACCFAAERRDVLVRPLSGETSNTTRMVFGLETNSCPIHLGSGLAYRNARDPRIRSSETKLPYGTRFRQYGPRRTKHIAPAQMSPTSYYPSDPSGSLDRIACHHSFPRGISTNLMSATAIAIYLPTD